MPLYFEDLVVGKVDRFGRYEVTREEVIEFASKYDPHAFHLDDDAAAVSIFGRLAASGWHTAAMAMRMIVEHWKETGMAETSRGGLGVDDLRWPHPAYPGDTLSVEIELLDKRESKSRPDVGIIRSRWSVFNQRDEAVMTVISNGLIARRPSENA